MADKQYEDMINGVIGQVDRVADKIIEIKTKYEPKSYDYSSVASTLSIIAADGGQQASITPPAGVATVPIGAYAKIIITPPGTPQETPGDDDQVTLNGSFLWINKVNTDIMQWKEIKTHVADGDKMVIERIADSGGFKNFQLVKWEAAQKASGGGRPETVLGVPPSNNVEVDIPFDKVFTGVFTIKPDNPGINFNNVPLLKTSDTEWRASLHIDGAEHSATLIKKANGKASIDFGLTGAVVNYSITYWKED